LITFRAKVGSAPIAIVITDQDSTSSRLLPGSSYSCCIRNLHALVHKQCHPVHILWQLPGKNLDFVEARNCSKNIKQSIYSEYCQALAQAHANSSETLCMLTSCLLTSYTTSWHHHDGMESLKTEPWIVIRGFSTRRWYSTTSAVRSLVLVCFVAQYTSGFYKPDTLLWGQDVSCPHSGIRHHFDLQDWRPDCRSRPLV
jgi:hypothetical protein